MTGSNSNNSPPHPQQHHPAGTKVTPLVTPTSPPPFHNLAPDCIHNILHFHIFLLEKRYRWRNTFLSSTHEEWDRSIYDLESDGIGNSNWNFLRKFAHCCCFFGNEGLREFLSACRDWSCKPTFSYLHLKYFSPISHMENGTVEYLRGIPELHFFICLPEVAHLHPLFHNIRGVKKLSIACSRYSRMIRVTTQNMENLRGIQEAHFDSCNFTDLPVETFQNLRGIQCLCLRGCSLRLSSEVLQNLRGIRELEIFGCDCEHNVVLSADDFKNVRGVQTLRIMRTGYPLELTDNYFVHLRGVKKLELDDEQAVQLTDAAFVNLRGVEEIHLQNLPKITSCFLKNIRGVKKLTLEGCPGIHFDTETLSNLPGSIRQLCWCDAFLKDSSENTSGGVNEEAFEQLHSVRKLMLKDHLHNISLSETAFSHLTEARQLDLHGIDLSQVRKLTTLLQDHMPHLQDFSVSNCLFNKSAVTDEDFISEGDRYKTNKYSFTMRKEENGEWSND